MDDLLKRSDTLVTDGILEISWMCFLKLQHQKYKLNIIVVIHSFIGSVSSYLTVVYLIVVEEVFMLYADFFCILIVSLSVFSHPERFFLSQFSAILL